MEEGFASVTSLATASQGPRKLMSNPLPLLQGPPKLFSPRSDHQSLLALKAKRPVPAQGSRGPWPGLPGFPAEMDREEEILAASGVCATISFSTTRHQPQCLHKGLHFLINAIRAYAELDTKTSHRGQ